MPTYAKDSAHVDTETFRHHITILQNTPTQTGDRGQSIPNWQTVYSLVPASIQPLSGRELELAKQLVINATHKITTRYLPEVGAVDWRIEWEGETFYIGFVQDPDYRHRILVMTCFSEKTP